MQQNGTLKKRKRRNLAKVNGLSTIQYDEADDNYDGVTVFPKDDQNAINLLGHGTQIRISSLLQNSQSAHRSNLRVTRDPAFHMEDDEDNNEGEIENGWISPPSSPRSQSQSGFGTVEERPYFLDKTTMTRLRQIILLGVFSGTFPWTWNSKKHRVERWSPGWEKLWNVQWFFVTVQTGILTLFQFYPMYKTAEEHVTSHRKLFMGSLNVFIYACAMCFNVNMYFYKEPIRQYINTLFRTNRKLMDKYVVDLEGYEDSGRLIMNLSIPSNMSQVVASIARFLVMPFQPWYLFSYILPKPWYWLIPGAFQEFLVIGQVIANFTLYMWVVVAHANSMEFWLRESHRNNESGYTISGFRHPKTSVETYKTLQVVSNRFNDCMAPMAIPMMKLHVLIAIIPCGFVFLRSLNYHFIEEFPSSLSFPIGFINTSTVGFSTMAVSATVFDLAAGFIDSWSRTKHKGFRRILMSCPTLRVKVARFYFITVATTITFFKVVADYIIDCIITFT
ncbi:unnamed protein product [Orchesella dallaii]|uniref:Gustatory receptor n=1 Tax=Orchesella dallaii TaxID=48710 RepID=A0ABP1RIQ3_9HEXA